jgi:transposase
MWHRHRKVLTAWYQEIQARALDSAVLHANETGRRVDGVTHRLWSFTTADLTTT